MLETTRQRAVCMACGNPLGYRKKRYCSPECVKAADAKVHRDVRARSPIQPTPCKECGVMVEYGGVGTPPKFCSDLCKRRYFTRQRRRRTLGVGALPTRRCKECGMEYVPSKRTQVYCSRVCYRRGNAKRPTFVSEVRRCDGCGVLITTTRHDHRFCSTRCANRVHGLARMRSTVRPQPAEQYADRDIFERDGWRCHLCGKLVKKTAKRTDPAGATIDHLVPLSRGGLDIPSNVATAHRRCNNLKGNRAGGDQLRLV